MADEIQLIQKIDDAEFLGQLDKILEGLNEIADKSAFIGDAVSDGMKEANAYTEIFNQTLKKNSEQVAQNAQSVKASETNLKTWIAAQKESVLGTQVAGKSLGEWGEQFKSLFIRQNEVAASTEKVTIAQRVLSTVLRASPLAILATIVGGVIAYFNRFQTAVDKVSQVVGAVNGVITELSNRLALVGSAFVNLLQGNFSEAFNDISDSVDNLGGALVDAATDAFNLEKRIQALRDAQIDASVSFARQKRVLDELKEASKDETLTYQQRTKAIKEAGEIEERIGKSKVELAKEARDILIDQTQKEQNRLRDLVRSGADESAIAEQRRKADRERTNTLVADREAVAAAEIALTEAIAEQEKGRRDLDKESRELQKKRFEERKKQLEEERKLLEGLAKDLDKLRVEVQEAGIDRDLAAVEKKYDDLIAITAKGIKSLNDIEKRRNLTPEELAQREELGNISVQLEARRLDALLNVAAEYAEKDIDIELKAIKSKQDLEAKDKERILQAIEDRRKLGDQEVDFIEAQGEGVIRKLEQTNAKESVVRQAKADLDELIQQKRLENEIEFNQRLLEVETDPARISSILATIRTLQTRLANLDFGAEIRDKVKPLSIYDLLGIKDDDDIRGALDTVVGEVGKALNEIADAAVKSAEIRTKAANDAVKDAEDAVKKNEDLAKEGLRNNLTAANLELAEKKKARDIALKEEIKAKRVQLALDSAGQLSSLYTASANIFASLSKIPIFGVPLAIGLIGTMFGAFATAKAKAFSLINESAPKLRTGKRITGRSHEGGGEDYTGIDGRRYELENKEWVIGTKPSTEHDRFLERLNKNEFRNLDLNALVDHRGKQVNRLNEPAKRIVKIQEDAIKAQAGHQYAAMVKAFDSGVEKMIVAYKERPVIKPWKKGYIQEERKGNTTSRKNVQPTD